MPTGIYIRRKSDMNFIREYMTTLSFVATEWLAHTEVEQSIRIMHARNGGEYRVGPKQVAVDGFCM